MDGNIGSEIGSKQSALTYVGGLAAAFVLSAIVAFFPAGDVTTWLNYLCTQLGFFIAAGVLFYLRREAFSLTVPYKRKISFAALAVTVPVTVGIFMQNTLLAVCFNKLLESVGVYSATALPDPSVPLNAVLGLICVCAAPALGEEFMFRGVLLGSYRPKGRVKAILLSALIFALGHFNPAQLVHQFILGAVLAYLVEATDNIRYAVAVHFFNNVLALFLGLVPGYNALAALDAQSAGILCAMCLAGAAVLYPSLYGLVKLAGRKELNPKERIIFFVFCKKAVVKVNNIWYHNNTADDKSDNAYDRKADLTDLNGRKNNLFARDPWCVALIVMLAAVTVLSALLEAVGAA